jgi:hypothetical protein
MSNISLNVNEVLKANPDTDTVIKGFARFLGVDPGGTAHLMRMDDFALHPLRAPFKVRFSLLMSEIDQGHIFPGQVFDCNVPAILEDLSELALKRYKKNNPILSKLLQEGGTELLFEQERRGVLFTKVAKEYGVNRRTVRRLYYQYLWGGQTDYAIVPRFDSCGAPEQEQQGDVKEGKDGAKRPSKKRGRKPKHGNEKSELPLPIVRENLVKGARLFYLHSNRSLKAAFNLMEKRYYVKGGRFKKEYGTKKLEEILVPQSERPTERQFRHVCEILEEKEGKRIKLPGRIRPRKAEKIIRGRARDGVLGPGYRYEIDATKLQIKLVSRWGREQIVGNPTLYVVIDIWSGCYVGYALSLHDASWALAAKALLNCWTPKDEVFKNLGLKYDGEDWPCQKLPTHLAADRAELLSNKAGNIPNIGIIPEIMPPMQPDRKGKVESAINSIKHRPKERPGSYPKNRQRREPDGNETAALTLDELERDIVNVIIGLNNDPVPLDYIPPELLKETDDVTHIGLYKWGLENRPGFFINMTVQEVCSNLMTSAIASLNSSGIYYDKQTFKSPRLTSAGYFYEPQGENSIEIRFDEHHSDYVLFFDKSQKEWVPAFNCNEEVRRLKMAFWEYEDFRDEANRLRESAKRENLHKEDERNKENVRIYKAAVREAKQARLEHPSPKGKKNTRPNKALEVAANDYRDANNAAKSFLAALNKAKKDKGTEDYKEPKIPENKQPPNQELSAAQLSKQIWRQHETVDE